MHDVQLRGHKAFKDVRSDKSFEELLTMAVDPILKGEVQRYVWHLPGNEAGIDAVVFLECASSCAGVTEGDLVAVGLQFKNSNLLEGTKTGRQLNGQLVQGMWDKLCPVLGGSWHYWKDRFALVAVCLLTKADSFDISMVTPIQRLKDGADLNDVRKRNAAVVNRHFAQEARVGQTVVLTFEELKYFYGPYFFPLVEDGDLLLSMAYMGSASPSATQQDSDVDGSGGDVGSSGEGDDGGREIGKKLLPTSSLSELLGTCRLSTPRPRHAPPHPPTHAPDSPVPHPLLPWRGPLRHTPLATPLPYAGFHLSPPTSFWVGTPASGYTRRWRTPTPWLGRGGVPGMAGPFGYPIHRSYV